MGAAAAAAAGREHKAVRAGGCKCLEKAVRAVLCELASTGPSAK